MDTLGLYFTDSVLIIVVVTLCYEAGDLEVLLSLGCFWLIGALDALVH